MSKKLIILLAFLLVAVPAFAVQLLIDDTITGNFNEINVKGAATSSLSGKKATLDVNEITQASTTAAIPVLTLDQDDVDQAVFNFQCTEGSDDTNTCSHYATTNATKSGTIKVEVNGTTRFINFYATPD